LNEVLFHTACVILFFAASPDLPATPVIPPDLNRVPVKSLPVRSQPVMWLFENSVSVKLAPEKSQLSI